MIMQRVLAKGHLEALAFNIENEKNSMLNRQRQLFGLRENIVCFPINIYIKPSININKGMKFTGLLKNDNSD